MNMIFFLLPFIFFGMFHSRTAVNIRIMTFNIRNGAAGDGPDSWENRKKLVFNLIRRSDCDFISLQEVLNFQAEEIAEALPEYGMIIRTREISPYEGESCPILYDTTKWKMIDHRTFWLSETPEVPGSRSWESSSPRIFTMAVFLNKNQGYGIYYYNTHFDHLSEKAREHSTDVLIRNIINNTSHEYILITGDLNAKETEPPVTGLLRNHILNLQDAYRVVHGSPEAEDATFYGWGPRTPGKGSRIDYIFASRNFRIINAEVSGYQSKGRYPSDHCPVVVEMELNN